MALAAAEGSNALAGIGTIQKPARERGVRYRRLEKKIEVV